MLGGKLHVLWTPYKLADAGVKLVWALLEDMSDVCTPPLEGERVLSACRTGAHRSQSNGAASGLAWKLERHAFAAGILGDELAWPR